MGIATDMRLKSPAPEPDDRHSDEWWTWYLRDTCPWCGQVAVRDDVCTVCLGRKSRPPSPWTSESTDPVCPTTSCPAEAPKEPGAFERVAAWTNGRSAPIGDNSGSNPDAAKAGERVPDKSDDHIPGVVGASVTAGETAPTPQGSSETIGRLGSTTKSAGSTPAAGTKRRAKKGDGQGSLF